MNKLIAIGLIIEAAYVIINRFVVKIPSKTAIPVLLEGIAFLVAGFVQMKQSGLV